MKREYDFSKGERGKFFHQNARLNLPRSIEEPDWAGAEGRLCEFITAETEKTIRAYHEQPSWVTRDANHEHDTAHGGYAHRQLFELVQNSADALADAPNGKAILIRLTKDYLYCADDGKAVDEAGLQALMSSYMSPKRNTSEIGRFGLGFKSVLGVTDAPEFYSRAGSFRFDRRQAAERISKVAQAERYPVFPLPILVDPATASEDDGELRELMAWATNIVRLPMKPGATDDLARQMREFPAEFLLFVDHVRYLTLEHGGQSRDCALEKSNGELRLDTGDGSSRWKCFKTTHTLSTEALENRRSLDDSGDVPIWWAAPLDRLHEPGNVSGRFWAFFPTHTASLLAGILNAPWKTNEDRQNLLAGPYNDELIDVAAKLVATHLPQLATVLDPARHLDALPRRHEAGDTKHSERLRDRLDEALSHAPVVPDHNRRLCKLEDISYAPREVTEPRVEEPLKKWEAFDLRPTDWLHHNALTRERLARIDRLFPRLNQAPRSSLWRWLEALVEGREGGEAIAASKAAIQVAAAIPEEKGKDKYLADIILAQNGSWHAPDPEKVFLPSSDGNQRAADHLVHAALAADTETVAALKALGIKHISAESRFRSLAGALIHSYTSEPNGTLWAEFWQVSRDVGTEEAFTIVTDTIGKENAYQAYQNWSICARARTGDWQPLHSILLPGDIVPPKDDQNSGVAVDTEFHREDLTLLERLGATATPRQDQELSNDIFFQQFLYLRRVDFTASDRNLPRKPQWSKLNFVSTTGSGPLQVLRLLSDEGRARYTDALLALETTYEQWTMRHETQSIYSELSFQSPAIELLKEHGRILCAGEIVPLKDAFGDPPANPVALRVLLSHPMAGRIKEAFGISEPALEPVGEEDPIPLTDVWPGLTPYLQLDSSALSLIHCQKLVADGEGDAVKCMRVDTNIYLVETGDDSRDLQLVSQELDLRLSDTELAAIQEYVPPQDVESLREAVRERKTDAERLLQAVGKDRLRSGLPGSLLAVLEGGGRPLTGIQLAEAAIATYHTSALKQFRHALTGLAPPARWAGSPYAIAFVISLGFPEEWAGQRTSRRLPFVEVDGPYSLPPLHDYQKQIVTKVREMLGNGHFQDTQRRGMISLPTGSGKTRVAVQAIVEAIRHGFSGGVLWVADRDELCEQAVEAWRQVWSSVGSEGKPLRVSRMWAGQPRPLPASDFHVIVATIQTLNAKLSNQPDEYKFVGDFNLVVFDEAHRSIAPTYTSVMQEIGLTRWQRNKEPFLLGLTATPYRGHDKEETARLIRRYGGNRLDAGAFTSDKPVDVITELQEMRVLAHADHETIEGGDFLMNQDELAAMQAMSYPAWLPRSMETRIALDAERTKRIVAAYENFVGHLRRVDSPTLIFATSVEHAKTVAALLNSKGVQSRAVSGETEASVRRDIVEQFRTGKLDVLVNYGVFREGFDAPRTRVIIVARPVYSPNLYFQMIGRGLRGPKNGGNERCLIVNVRDNIENFNKALAFSELDWLWG